ncbi:MAG: hypothetical protein ACOCVC_02960 [Spirochaeta sp.]
MKKIILGLVILAAAVALSGCMTTYTATDGNLAYAEVEGEARGGFAVEEGYMYVIHPSLFVLGENPATQLDVVLQPTLQAADANAATNLVIRDGFSFMDLVLTSIVPVVSWGTLEVEGSAIEQ